MAQDLIEKRRKDTIFLLKSNSRSEDVLDYPQELLQDLGMNVVRIIDLEDKQSLAKTHELLNREPNVQLRVISSAHFLVSSRTMLSRLRPSRWVDYDIHEFMSLADTMRVLKPEKVYWLTHDIFDPFLKEDMPFLPLVDCLFLPTEELASQATGLARRIRIPGWPRMSPRLAELTASTTHESAWFISFFQAIQDRWTPDAFALDVEPLIRCDVVFKFPAWTNTRPYEDAIRNLGGTCVDAEETSLDLLAQTALPIITAHSGLEGEAQMLGKPYVRFHFPIRTFDPLPGECFAECDSLDRLVELIRSPKLPKSDGQVPVFDKDMFLSEVLADAAVREDHATHRRARAA